MCMGPRFIISSIYGYIRIPNWYNIRMDTLQQPALTRGRADHLGVYTIKFHGCGFLVASLSDTSETPAFLVTC